MILEAHKKYYIEHLKELGFDEKKAEGIIELHIESGSNLVTKEDLKSDINRLESKIGKIETNINWLIAISLANFTVLLSGIIGVITMLLSK